MADNGQQAAWLGIISKPQGVKAAQALGLTASAFLAGMLDVETCKAST